MEFDYVGVMELGEEPGFDGDHVFEFVGFDEVFFAQFVAVDDFEGLCAGWGT